MRTWDELTEYFEEASRDPRPSWAYAVTHAQAMLRLIPRLRVDPRFAHLETGTALDTLFLTIPNQTQTVQIWGEENHKFTIRLMEGLSELSKVTVPEVEVFQILERYLEKLQTEHMTK